MIRLPDTNLPDNTAASLAQYQAEIDAIGDYAGRVERARQAFATRNRTSNATFRVIRASLAEMCSGVCRCCYCEDSVADEVEHMRPKDLYPGQTFHWPNYVYACGPCNGPKNNRFGVIPPGETNVVDVRRRRGDDVVPPIEGQYGVIDPRAEDPLDFMELDLRDTFNFVPSFPAETVEGARAEYTIQLLGLNERDYLVEVRKLAFDNYRARLHDYVAEKQKDDPRLDLEVLLGGIKKLNNPTVWAEMKRQRNAYPELQGLFESAPEALAI